MKTILLAVGTLCLMAGCSSKVASSKGIVSDATMNTVTIVTDKNDTLSFSTIDANKDEGNFVLRLYCVDPSGNISDRISMGCSTIFFSATLLPVNYYKEMLSGEIDDYAVYAHSPFKAEKKCIVASKDVSSRYTRRQFYGYSLKTPPFIIAFLLPATTFPNS